MEGRPIIGGACAQHDKRSTAVKIQDGYVLSNSVAKHLLAQAFPDCQEKQLQGHVEDASVVRKMGAAAGYGEIPFASAAKLLRRLELTKEDTFFDLGSGVGKFCLQAFLAQKVGSIVGVEMGPTRHGAAIAGRQALAELLSSLDAQLDAGFCAGGVQVLGGRPSTNSNFLQQKGLGADHCRRSAAMQSQKL
ncbi:unnamed protein product [Amoebophrya sp. A120]|nr:unnamed protein product [Amoebophrya sp. A120]|eukprot:GSA120T00015404001.1